jgi:hypothetical protein
MSISLICGYLQHGKSTFSKKRLQFHPTTDLAKIENIAGGYYQLVFTKKGDVTRESFPESVLTKGRVSTKDFAMGHVLKVETHKELGLEIPEELWESLKDTMKVRDLETGEYHSLRYYYIEYAKEVCESNPTYFANYIAKQIPSLKEGIDYSVSDWRKNIECKLFVEKFGQDHVTTIRVFRSGVPIPAKDFPLEHELDLEQTDQLLLQSMEDLKEAVKLWPQYADYALAGVYTEN